MSFDDLLPPEIWREILTRLSVKTILQCRSVCKSWYSLICRPNFISDYSTRNLNKNGDRVLLRLYNNDFLSYSSYDESSTMESYLGSYLEIFGELEVVGSCNGLICLSNTSHGWLIHDPGTRNGLLCSSGRFPVLTFLLWNPTIRKIVELPSRPFCPCTQILSYLGFGFDSKTNDYKILRIVCNIEIGWGDDESYGHIKMGDITDATCEIFDLRKGVWRVIYPRLPSSIWSAGGRDIPECYLDGAVFWSDHRVLSSFSFTDECFREIKMPDSEHSGSYYNTRCVTFSGLIHVIIWVEDCSIWAMKEYGVTESWTRMFNIDLRDTPLRPNQFLLWKNGEVLSVYSYRVDIDGDSRAKIDLVSYSPEDGKIESLFWGNISDFCLYEESLVLM